MCSKRFRLPPLPHAVVGSSGLSKGSAYAVLVELSPTRAGGTVLGTGQPFFAVDAVERIAILRGSSRSEIGLATGLLYVPTGHGFDGWSGSLG